jgi:branched-subunit amino acid transport protein AzlD
MALIRQWQTISFLLLALGFTLGMSFAPGHVVAALAAFSMLFLPLAASYASLRLGYRRPAMFVRLLGAGMSGILFCSAVDGAAIGAMTVGFTAATAELSLAALFLGCATATLSSYTGTLWHLASAAERLNTTRRPPLLQQHGSLTS